jgi:hypothetical protein
MSALPPDNDGGRPSRLQLDRYLAGELEGPDRDRVAAYVEHDPRGRAHAAEIAQAREATPPLDLDALRARAARPDEPTALPRPANTPFPRNWLAAIALAAAALLAVLAWPRDPVVQFKGDVELSTWELRDGSLVPYEGGAKGRGDTLGFRVRPAAHRSAVVLSVDGAGAVTVFWPETGDAPLPLVPAADGVATLPGSVVLDGAPGPEVFVAVFDVSVTEARTGAEDAWRTGGAAGVRAWARARGGATSDVERR